MNFNIDSKKIIILYAVLVIIIFVFSIGLYGYDRANDTRQQQSPYAITKWTNYTTRANISKTILHGTLQVDNNIDNILAFYTTHQNVEVHANGKLIYQYPIENNNPFAKSPGYCWNFIELPVHTQDIEIFFSSPYQAYLNYIPKFYIGNNFSLLSFIVASNLMPFLLCVIMLVVGVVLILYHLVMVRNISSQGKILKLGIFSLFLSVWSMNECCLTTLIMKNNIVTSYISFLSLMILPIPFALFVKTFYEDESNIWDNFYKFNLLQIICCILLQLTGVADLRNTLWSTHAMLAILAVIIFYQSYKMLKNGVHSRMVKIHLFCICICIVTLALDMTGFYAGSADSNTFGRIGFLAYIIVLGVSSTLETTSLIKKGQEANAYQQLAYTDQMTGLNNRTCFNIDFESLSQAPDDVTVIAFDLNNLKYTNDTFGHSAGDRYIKNCATIIYEIFNGIGKCYRVGGDEFVTLIEHSSSIDLRKYLAMLESSVDSSNRENRELRMQIAYGCALYTPETDKNLEATYNRADNNMYQDKKAKKDPKNKR